MDTESAKALNMAILVLLIPTIAIFIAILLWAFRSRNRDSTAHSTS